MKFPLLLMLAFTAALRAQEPKPGVYELNIEDKALSVKNTKTYAILKTADGSTLVQKAEDEKWVVLGKLDNRPATPIVLPKTATQPKQTLVFNGGKKADAFTGEFTAGNQKSSVALVYKGSCWVCAHTPGHMAASREERLRLAAKHGCTGWTEAGGNASAPHSLPENFITVAEFETKQAAKGANR